VRPAVIENRKRCTALLSAIAAAATLLVADNSAAAADTRPEVTTRQGRAAGVVRGGVAVYYNLPFAAPPTGERRWRAPRAAATWPGLRDASEPGPGCVQELDRGGDQFPHGTAEDCLYLNVFAPGDAGPGHRYPVMVWIHGGSFRWGSAMDPAYDGSAFARAGIVLVAINYRLDRLGRFAHPSLTATQHNEALGNYGLMDQVAALQWVRNNISAFGGNHRNVTIFGCSAGGVSVDFLMTAPAARGLFHRAIAQSGSVVPEGERQLSRPAGRFRPLEQDGIEFARYHGLAGERATAAELRALSAEQVIAYPNKEPSMQPVVDGRLIREEPALVFARGQQAHVPFMSGAATFEASLIKPFRLPLQAVLLDTSRTVAERVYATTEPERLKDLYFGDSLFLSTAYFLTAQMGRVRQHGYLYEYGYVNEEQRLKNPGAYHCSETPRLFGTEWRGEAATAPDRAMGDVLRQYWVAFARNGKPAAGSLPAWPANTESRPQLLSLTAEPRAVAAPHAERMALHMRRFDRVRQLATQR
jgi:para-nitrobenzyl esterase